MAKSPELRSLQLNKRWVNRCRRINLVKSGTGCVFAGRVPPLGAVGAAGALCWGGGNEEGSENHRIV